MPGKGNGKGEGVSSMGCSQLRTWRIKQNGHGRALSEYIFLAQKPKGSAGRAKVEKGGRGR